MNALHWRVIASRLWSPEVGQALAINTALLKGQDKIRASKAREAARSIHDVLFPKDD